MTASSKKQVYIGISLAVLAAFIWSGNFIVARGVIRQIPPVTLAFYRWLTASIIILPFALPTFRKEWPVVKTSWHYIFWVSLTGVTLFNTFVYIGAHYTTATNLALIGTTVSPIVAIILARIFLKEEIGWLRTVGLVCCICGVLFLLSGGNWDNLVSLKFTKGDGWVLLAALSFAIYNTLIRKKPIGLSSINFLFVIFATGTILLFPWFLWEGAAVEWNLNLVLIILFLGLGASVVSFLCWNIAIGKLGAGRTALFGNLILVFSTIEAVLILNEQFTWVHVVSMTLVFAGIFLANRQKK